MITISYQLILLHMLTSNYLYYTLLRKALSPELALFEPFFARARAARVCANFKSLCASTCALVLFDGLHFFSPVAFGSLHVSVLRVV
jgi:hypothetical protein